MLYLEIFICIVLLIYIVTTNIDSWNEFSESPFDGSSVGNVGADVSRIRYARTH